MTQTTIRNPDDELSRDGTSAILVTAQSATRNCIDSDTASTFPIRTNHSEMVKFGRGSEYYDESIGSDPPGAPERLEMSLRAILSQRSFALDLTLFFDAVDEFDGHRKFILRFLGELVQNRAESLTRVKVLFSSRPWESSKKKFQDCPGLKIHEMTENDIRLYCTITLSELESAPSLVTDLVPEIVQRSQGVFLWVKLVIKDLSAFVSSVSSTDLRVVQQKLPRLRDPLRKK
ncbi:hypothetical protein PT974_03408 [Cladobotryum mycophilum]|uniref:Uncharacterized protein n=1 Tax=Cladobotryum mycophilum TaxID=491253 RepID=A0ABR0STE5_9HYPO